MCFVVMSHHLKYSSAIQLINTLTCVMVLLKEPECLMWVSLLYSFKAIHAYKTHGRPLYTIFYILLSCENSAFVSSIGNLRVKGQGLLGYVTGATPPPPISSPEFAPWNRQDATILSCLISSLLEEVAPDSVDNTSKELRDALREIYQTDSTIRTMNLRVDLSATEQQNLSITAYFNKCQRIRDELSAINKSPTHEDYMRQVLTNLRPEFSEVRTNILPRVAQTFVADAKSQLMAHEYMLAKALGLHAPAPNPSTIPQPEPPTPSAPAPRQFQQPRPSFQSRGNPRPSFQRCVCLETGRVYIAKHVEFHESTILLSKPSLLGTPPISPPSSVPYSTAPVRIDIEPRLPLMGTDPGVQQPSVPNSPLPSDPHPLPLGSPISRSSAGSPPKMHVLQSDANRCPLWHAAIQDEIDAMMRTNTLSLVPQLPSMHVIGCRWIYKLKKDAQDTFSPVVKHRTVRLMLTLTITFQWPLRQIDIQNAFLHGDLVETVYMQQPPGFISDSSLAVLLSQSNNLLMHFLGLPTCETWGVIDYYLGISLRPLADGSLFLSQRQYIVDMLDRLGMSSCKGVSTPIATSTVLSSDPPFTNPKKYRKAVRTLQYVTLTRPGLAFAVNRVCQFMHDPHDSHWDVVKRILQYFQTTKDQG
ncbi:hypothetical protein LIER_31152 [Lithospermum erythrorhizon]|uniref:Reverse transcriptase Ty1/copia-type domain-containing protein n=1 Tax=Lithospermum erythrorhizon TaxID=34254 RepID=A0AAV3RR27_LITER